MRVIAGRFRSRVLNAPRGSQTRPTSDRLRETLFNVLTPRIEGAKFVDLYAGSGAVGIEALSRGASFVWMAENASSALKAIHQNLDTLQLANEASVYARGTNSLLEELLKQGEQIDLVFLDPPYDDSAEYIRTLEVLGGKCSALLAADARVIAEHRKGVDLADRYGRLERVRVLKQGDAVLSFFAIRPES